MNAGVIAADMRYGRRTISGIDQLPVERLYQAAYEPSFYRGIRAGVRIGCEQESETVLLKLVENLQQ